MPKVIGTHGAVVDVQLLGVGEVIRLLRLAGKEIEGNVDLGVVKAGAWIQEEVKESISGHRAEPQSVDTGLLVESIIFKKTGKAEGIVKPDKKTYPTGKANTEQVATILEYGTSISGGPRAHFRNTADRQRKNVKEIIEKEIKLGKI